MNLLLGLLLLTSWEAQAISSRHACPANLLSAPDFKTMPMDPIPMASADKIRAVLGERTKAARWSAVQFEGRTQADFKSPAAQAVLERLNGLIEDIMQEDKVTTRVFKIDKAQDIVDHLLRLAQFMISENNQKSSWQSLLDVASNLIFHRGEPDALLAHVERSLAHLASQGRGPFYSYFSADLSANHETASFDQVLFYDGDQPILATYIRLRQGQAPPRRGPPKKSKEPFDWSRLGELIPQVPSEPIQVPIPVQNPPGRRGPR